MNTPYLYETLLNSGYATEKSAIVMLPDIFGLTEYAKNTAEELASTLKKQVYMYEYFYALNARANVFAPEDTDEAVELMNRMRGEDFIQPFKDVIEKIKVNNPNIVEIIVIGFCFGGRLAYLAGALVDVSHAVSFYGGGAHTQGYIEGLTPIEYLVSRRRKSNLGVLAFFGTQDQSISIEDRDATKNTLVDADITYTAHEYDAGHAYFQQGRPNYNEAAAKASWRNLNDFIT